MSFLQSKLKRALQLLACVLVMTLNSCVYLVIGGVGAVGGYAISPDTIEGVISGHSPSEAWHAAEEVAGIMGIIEERNEAAGMMLCKIQGAKVTITIMRMGESTVKIVVKSRKAFFPKIKISEDVYLRIHNYLTGSPA